MYNNLVYGYNIPSSFWIINKFKIKLTYDKLENIMYSSFQTHGEKR